MIFGTVDVTGKSVLDVGCAEGFFSFEAERRGARQVTGYEPKASRYEEAESTRRSNNSDVTFVHGNIESANPSGTIDIVLLLNVLHHLVDPISTIRQLADSVGDCLVIEFATLSDPKFQSDLSAWRRWMLGLILRGGESAGLIGVSSLRDHDQTFLLSDAALERILRDHDELVGRIDFVDSPIANRRLAFCWR